MQQIGLDRTLNESFNLLKEYKEEHGKLPNYLKVYTVFGKDPTAYFKGGGDGFPARDIGLANLCFLKALETFYTTKIMEDGSTQRVFEELSQDKHICDGLQEFSSEVLGWYKDKDGNPLEFCEDLSSPVVRPDLTNYEKYFNLDKTTGSQSLYRSTSIEAAINSAIAVYGQELLNEGKSEEEVNNIIFQERNERSLAVCKFFSQSQNYFNDYEIYKSIYLAQKDDFSQESELTE